MSLWGTIASAVIGSGAKALFGASKTSKRNMPSFRVTKVRGMALTLLTHKMFRQM